jgi:hypothetical protein
MKGKFGLRPGLKSDVNISGFAVDISELKVPLNMGFSNWAEAGISLKTRMNIQKWGFSMLQNT